MAIQALVRYKDGTIEEVFSVSNIGHVENVMDITKITFYNQAIDYLFLEFENIPKLKSVDFHMSHSISYYGDMAKFLVGNW